MWLTLNTDPINTQQLVSPLQTSMSVSHTPRDDSANVDWRVLLLAPHHVEAKALLCLGELNNSWMSMTF